MKKVQYPPLPLLIKLQAYWEPRFLRAQGCLSEPMLPKGFIGAGCRRANSLARVDLCDILNGLHRPHAMVHFRQYVDDLILWRAA